MRQIHFIIDYHYLHFDNDLIMDKIMDLADLAEYGNRLALQKLRRMCKRYRIKFDITNLI